MNRENITKVRDHIAGLPPKQFDMGDFGRTTKCGTVACIAGWTDVIIGGDEEPTGLSTKAAELLGLEIGVAISLFYARHPVDDTNYWAATTAQAVHVLDHLLATGEVDWSIIDEAASPNTPGHSNGGES